MIWDELLQNVRAALIERTVDATEPAKAISEALDAYVRAHEHRLAVEFAARNNLPIPAGDLDTTVAALRLRDLVAAIPGLRSGGGGEARHLPPPDRGAPPASASSPGRRETMEILTLDEAQRQLASEFDAVRFSSMRLEQFLLYAEEFAAAARALQERTRGDPLSLRVIRRLTALVYERELSKRVFGLSRGHSADWQRLANETRARRLAAETKDQDSVS